MRIHHLSCGTMRPLGVPEAICHVFLCETAVGLTLVDSGLGLADFANPERMGPARFMLRPEFDERNTAVRQIEALGYHVADIAHIVLTHMDFDHIGGIADFPAATIHTTALEYDTAAVQPSFYSRQRYR
jgi:glyoxylase-like metal-dependent hydrolase (beta-lactamase superfamily II)